MVLPLLAWPGAVAAVVQAAWGRAGAESSGQFEVDEPVDDS